MKLIVGLGNPGRKYEKQRHNVGFRVLDRLAEWGMGGSWSSRFDGLTTDVRVGGEKVVLLKPMTYMNRSGRPVRQAVDFFKIPLEEVLVVCDDFNLPLGRLRLRSKGSAGGQNGLKDICAHLGGDAVGRLRVGVGDPGRSDPADYVLSDFPAADREAVEEMIVEAGRAAETWAREGIEVAMNEFNGKPGTKE